jgi:C2 domain-containing protein 3
VCITVGIVRACGLKVIIDRIRSSRIFHMRIFQHAIQIQAQHDTRLTYSSQVGINTYAKLSLSFLSDMVGDSVDTQYVVIRYNASMLCSKECRTTRTVARSFVPEFNHSIDFPVPLIWNDQCQRTISLAEMLEHAELKIDLYHQMNAPDNNNNNHDRQPIDIHLCYCTISLRELLARHTGLVT